MQQCIFADILRKMSARAANPLPFCLLRAGKRQAPVRSERAIIVWKQKGAACWPRPFYAGKKSLQVLLVALNHLLDHLAADGTGLARGEIAVVALLEVDANLPWCTPVILKCPFTHDLRYDEGERRHAHRNVKQAPLWCVGRI